MYTKPMPLALGDKTAPKQIYLVRLNMGRVWELYTSEKKRRFPPDNSDTARAIGGPYGSGHSTLHDEYIVYDQRRTQIAFRFTYRHAASCQCQASVLCASISRAFVKQGRRR